MKWEILKGSEKDFEGAPNWVTLKTHVEGAFFWLEKNEECANYLEVGRDTFYIGKISLIPPRAELIAERRPITEPDVTMQVTTEWSGEGLPPVGAKVMSLSGAAIIDFVGKDVIVYTNADGQWSVRCDGVHGRLSPLQPEDMARDAAIEAMRDVGYTLPAAIRFTKEEMTAMYDAGYRKVE